MKKEKLIKAISEQDNDLDERELSIKDYSYRWSFLGVYVAIGVIYIFRLMQGMNFVSDLAMIMLAQAGFMSYSLHKKGRNVRLNLIMILITSVLFLVAAFFTLGYYELI